MITVGAFEAKTRLAHLLDKAEAGEEILITRRGQPVAKLMPVKTARLKKEMKALIEEIKRTRKGRDLGGVSVRELVNEGRKY
jgi:prevent-host-death family protein